jgi:hypothetical protein
MISIFTRNGMHGVWHPLRTWRAGKAAQAHVRRHPECAWCGRTGQGQGHHIIPVWQSEALEADPDNFVTLCGKRGCHRIIGHNGDFARRYVVNVLEVCEKKGVVIRTLESDKNHQDG